MKKIFLIALGAGLISFSGCKKDHPDNKIMDSLPVDNNKTVLPGNAVQQMMILQKNVMNMVITVINKTTLLTPTYPELSGGPGSYNFSTTESHIGTANFTIQFFDSSNGAIDPIASQISSSTIKSVTIVGGGASALFPTYTENITLILDTAGDINSPMRIGGTISFSSTGNSYVVPFAIAPSAVRVNIEGMRDGLITVSGGTSPGGPVTMNLHVGNDHSVDGNMTWDGESGGVHISNSGDGFITTTTSRILLY